MKFRNFNLNRSSVLNCAKRTYIIMDDYATGVVVKSRHCICQSKAAACKLLISHHSTAIIPAETPSVLTWLGHIQSKLQFLCSCKVVQVRDAFACPRSEVFLVVVEANNILFNVA